MARSKPLGIVEASWFYNYCGMPKVYQNPLQAALNLFHLSRQEMAAELRLTEGQVRHYVYDRTPIPKERMGAAFSILKKALVGARLALIESGNRPSASREKVFPEQARYLRAKIRAAEAHLRHATGVKAADDRELCGLYAKHLRIRIRRYSKPINWDGGPSVSREERVEENRLHREMLRTLKAELKQLKVK